jgi:hypothetical protein
VVVRSFPQDRGGAGQGGDAEPNRDEEGLYRLSSDDNPGGVTPKPIDFTKGLPADFPCWFSVSAKNGRITCSNREKEAHVPSMKPGTPERGPLLKK